MDTSSIPIPELLLHDATSNDEFESYFRELKTSISKEETVRSRTLRLTDAGTKVEKRIEGEDGNLIKTEKLVKDENYLKFVPFVYGEFKVNVIFDAENNYLVGFLTEELDSRRMCYLIVENNKKNEETTGKIESCVNLKYESDNIFIYTEVGVGYPDLEKTAGLKRKEILLGRQALIEAIKFLSTHQEKSILDNLPALAKHCIVITQMFSESFRVKELAEYRLTRFVDGFLPPEYIVIKEHGWKIASKSLQSKHDKHKHELHVADVREDRLTDADIHRMYDLLRKYDDKELESPMTSDFDKVMTTKYVDSFLGDKFVKSRKVEFESTDEVTAVVHIFERYVVLQYNHLGRDDVRVDVEVLSSNSFNKTKNQPLQKLDEGRTFVTFERREYDARATFSSNWVGKSQDVSVDTNILPSLDVLKLLTRDYFNNFEVANFYKLEKTLKFDEADSHCLHFSHSTFCKDKILKDAIKGFEELFGMKLGNDQVNQTVEIKRKLKGTKPPEERTIREKKPSKKKEGLPANKNRRIVYAMYLKKFQVFLTVTFRMLDEKVQHSKVTAVCQGNICRDAVKEILKDWHQDDCKCFSEENLPGLRPSQNSNLPSVE